MTEHPEELLAAYVDGALDDADRAEVEAHVSSCPRCREEVALASEAHRALAAQPDEAPPEGLTLRILREARAERGSPGRWSTTARVVAAAGVAAVLITAGVVVLRGSGDPAGREAIDQGPAVERDAPFATPQDGPAAGSGEELFEPTSDLRTSQPVFRVEDRDLQPEDVPRLLPRLAAGATESLEQGFPPTAEAFFAGFDPERVPRRVARALECITEELPPDDLIVPFVIEASRFEGEPAYVAAFLQGPEPSAPYDRVLVWVVARESCALRTFASQRL
jgi:hypothetical protein